MRPDLRPLGCACSASIEHEVRQEYITVRVFAGTAAYPVPVSAVMARSPAAARAVDRSLLSLAPMAFRERPRRRYRVPPEEVP